MTKRCNSWMKHGRFTHWVVRSGSKHLYFITLTIIAFTTIQEMKFKNPVKRVSISFLPKVKKRFKRSLLGSFLFFIEWFKSLQINPRLIIWTLLYHFVEEHQEFQPSFILKKIISVQNAIEIIHLSNGVKA